MKPYHEHDCKACVYLGSLMMPDGPFDFYWHEDTVLARRSDKGSDYWSMPISMVRDDKYMLAFDMSRAQAENKGRQVPMHGPEYMVVSGMQVLARYMLDKYQKE